MNLGATVRLNRTGWAALGVVLCIVLVLHLSRSPRESKGNEASRLTTPYDVAQLLKIAVAAARAGGEVVAGTSPDTAPRSKGKTREGVEQPVTVADLESHCRMSGVIKAEFPDIKLISEEKPEDACPSLSPVTTDLSDLPEFPQEFVSAKDVTVWIDPLDATKEYTEKLYKYVTTMVCVAIRGVPIIGVVHKPFTKETYWTWISKGSSTNFKLDQNREKSSKLTRVIVSISHQGEVKKFANEVFGNEHEIIAAAGAGYKVLEVVQGNADVYIHKTLIKKWDICAGNAILNYFDGRMTTLDNATIDYSYTASVKNDRGLLAALKNHGTYMEKIKHSDI